MSNYEEKTEAIRKHVASALGIPEDHVTVSWNEAVVGEYMPSVRLRTSPFLLAVPTKKMHTAVVDAVRAVLGDSYSVPEVSTKNLSQDAFAARMRRLRDSR